MLSMLADKENKWESDRLDERFKEKIVEIVLRMSREEDALWQSWSASNSSAERLFNQAVQLEKNEAMVLVVEGIFKHP